MTVKICTRCNIEKNTKLFVSRTGKDLKMCSRCRSITISYVIQCVHNRSKYTCSLCKAAKNTSSKYCEHGTLKISPCEECGIEYCEHGSFKHHCTRCQTIKQDDIKSKIVVHDDIKIKLCMHDIQISSCVQCRDVLNILVRTMIINSKKIDVHNKLYDADRFIDKCFIEMTLYESRKCHRCSCKMQFAKNTNNLCTVDRLDQSIGHVKSNCILVCKKCTV
jgi:hypothetical protein